MVILTSGIARKPGQSRLDLAQTNVNITKSIIPQIVKYAPDAIYIIVSNPVDILTYVFHKVSGLPESHIIGSGTILDTARLRARLAEYYNINQQNVHAYVFGEHGDTSFVPWSMATISTIPIDQYACKPDQPPTTIEPELVLRRGGELHPQVRRQDHRAQGRDLLRRCGFGLPHRASASSAARTPP